MRTFLVCLTIMLLTVSASAQKDLKLEDAINIALQKNTTLQKNLNNLKNYEAGLLAAYGNFLPTLGASGRWSWTRNEVESDFISAEGLSSITTETRSYSAGVGADWVLFDGLANYGGLSQSKNNLESAKLSIERLKQDVVFQVVNLYYDVVNTQQLLKFKEDDVKWNQKNLETITERNKLGAVTLADVYAQQVRTGNAELEVIRTKNLLETSKSNLLYYLGLDVLENYRFEEEFTASEKQMLETRITEDYKNISSLVEQALESRPDFQSSLLNRESAYDGITIARSGHFPRLTGDANYGIRANRFSDISDNKSLSVGLTLSIPIFSGWSVSERVQTAEVLAENSEIDVIDLERTIKKDIQKAYLDLQAAEKGLLVSQKNVIAAEENQKIEQEKYSLGAGTLLNVLIANSEYSNAQTNYINAQFAYIVLSEQLKYYLGVLDFKKYE
ncbi:MAG: TolC family protein [Ignavibacteriales bacterium]|nr:MAG: TolC family protein [Ignavibacteriales bacterium]